MVSVPEMPGRREVQLTLTVRRNFDMVWKTAKNSDNFFLGCASAAVGLIVGIATLAQVHRPQALALTPSEMTWMSQGLLAASGMEQVNLVGNPLRSGPYTLRLKLPKGASIAPHTHPDAREVTILSGVFATGYGATFDSARLKMLPAGKSLTPSPPMCRFSSRSKKTPSCT